LSKRSSASREECEEALEEDLVGLEGGLGLLSAVSTGLVITGCFGGFFTSLTRRLFTGGELIFSALFPSRLDTEASTDSSSPMHSYDIIQMYLIIKYYST